LQTESGYSPASMTYFAPTAGFLIPTVSASPSAAEIKVASDLLTTDLFAEFPFTGLPEKAHAVAALLCPFARELIQGPTPCTHSKRRHRVLARRYLWQRSPCQRWAKQQTL
jgi:hypothetical protein